MKGLGAKLRQLRWAAKLTVSQLTSLSGVGEGVINICEDANVEDISLVDLALVCSALGCELQSILHELECNNAAEEASSNSSGPVSQSRKLFQAHIERKEHAVWQHRINASRARKVMEKNRTLMQENEGILVRARTILETLPGALMGGRH
jgi:DNA-binding Xre family transcriptional regulator